MNTNSFFNISLFRALAIAGVIVAALLAVFVMFNSSLSTGAFFTTAEACCGSDGGSDGGGDDRPDPPERGCTDPTAINWDPQAELNDGSCRYATPVCDSFTASPQTIEAGSKTKLTWNTTNAHKVTIFGGAVGAQPVDGSIDVSPLFTTTYRLVAQSNLTAAKDECTVRVTVTPKVVPPVCESFTASPSTINRGGESTLRWNTTNATKVTLQRPIGVENVNVDGSIKVSPWNNYTFRLTVTGPGGTVHCDAPVKVTVPTPAPTCDSFTASPSTINRGDQSTLRWNTTNATDVKLVRPYGQESVNPDGTQVVEPFNDFTFKIIAKGPGGTVECDAPVKVNVPTPISTKCTISASAEVVDYGGSVTINWDTTGFTDIKLNGQTITDQKGSKTFTNLQENTTYSIVATNSNGDRCQAVVRVACLPPVVPPVCKSFTASPSTIERGEQSTLTWKTTNATKVTLERPTGTENVSLNGSLQVSPWNDFTFKLTVTGKDGTVHCEAPVKVTVPPPVLPPECTSFTAAPATITAGEESVLTWTTANATRVAINGGIGAVDPNGSKTVAPLQTTTYKATVFGADNKKVYCEAKVTVKPKIITGCTDPKANNYNSKATKDDGSCTYAAPICDMFVASPDAIIEGGKTTLTWETTDATDVRINNGVGVVAEDGSQDVSPASNTTYTLTATGVDGTKVSCKAPVTVSADPVPVCESFTATPKSLPVGGGDVKLAWEVTGATDVTISPTVGSVALVGDESVNVTESTTYKLTATDSNGDKVSCVAPVAVADPVPVFTCEDNVTFTASDRSISRGQSSTLTWDVTDADSVSVTGSGINETGLTGSEAVSPSGDATYTLTATKSGFDDISCTVDIDVSSGGGGGGSSSPRCELDISDTKISRGDEITLTWDSSRATALTITDDRGNVVVTTDGKIGNEKDELFEGDIDLRPTRDTEYTLVVERGSRDRECEVEIEVEDDEIVLLQTRDQAPLVAGISLTEVPYTGFEAGPVMTVLFYALLVAWAMYLTYVLVIPKTSLATAPVIVTPKTAEDLMQQAESIRPDVFAPLAPESSVTASAAATYAPANLPTAQVAEVPAFVTEVAEQAAPIDVATEVENIAHAHQALLSSGAVQSLIGMTTEENRSEVVTKIVQDAKGAFPMEDGWVVINQARLAELTAVAVAPQTTVSGSGSLAEAVVTGNVVAAYDLIGARPMIALADASADLDAVYRNRKGAKETVSDLLAAESAKLSDQQIADMIAALTGALDGTYTDEASAVKMAIMKAIKVAG